ncbi:helix-turn-helix domain-containing protein [Paenibacillus naphthalenovorans]|uniref:helix-turn-helix domain-containing protein n=1 Tax=Paenibacillus naphthalenovorans TaxID=162209 RepID=UPI003D2827AA
MSFAERLIALREEKGLSQYDVAERLGIKRPRYNAWEQGLSKPRADMIEKLAELFGVTTDYLLGHTPSDTSVPSWATKKDIRDFKKMLEEDATVMFDGVPIEGEARQRVMDILTGLFWEAKEMNKKTYGRKKKKDSEDN